LRELPAGGAGVYAQVIVDIAHENVAHVYTYRIPENMGVWRGSRVRVPFGYRLIEGIVLKISGEAVCDVKKIKDIDAVHEAYPAVTEPLIDLAEEMAQDAHCPLAQTLRLMLPAVMRSGRNTVRTELTARLRIPASDIPIPSRAVRMRAMVSVLSDGLPHTLTELLTLVNQPRETLKKMEASGYVALDRQENLREPYARGTTGIADDYVLTAQQREVLDEMMPNLTGGKGKYLLYGVTGSGKTEVYIHLVRRALEMGKSAIILVPEISLTPQMVMWFRGRFPDEAAVMHSRLSDGERYDEWRRVRLGKARVVIGARSAIFAPVENLGLVVVDEEHESSYRSDRFPRYDARDVALSRASREGALVLFSSATPSIASFAKARRGEYILLEMDRRVLDRPLPRVHIADMRKELENGNRSIFSAMLREKLIQCIQAGNQAILFLNRRGYSFFVTCRKCGYTVRCRQCDVSMTYHKKEGELLKCHYCGCAEPLPVQCPECGSAYIRFFGLGTQQVEEEAKKLLPHARAIRMDMDTTGGKDAHHVLLSRFRNKEAQLLIGTQMIAKGLDFPDVTLVGVIAADLMLRLPDYRSRERTFQLLTQVAGRAGRGDAGGEVVIQTYKPDEDVIGDAARQDYRSFFESEYARREKCFYPPITMLARILVESADAERARAAVEVLFEKCKEAVRQNNHLRRYLLSIHRGEAPVRYIKGITRYQVLMKLLDREEIKPLLGMFSDIAHDGVPSCAAVFEVNPASMI